MLPWIVLLAIVGLVLAIAEIFIPGFGIFGIMGSVALILSTIMIAHTYGTVAFLVTVLVLIVLCVVFFNIIKKKKIYDKFILTDKLQAQDFDESTIKDLIGKEGVTVTPLRPNGKAQFEKRQVEVFSEGDFVDRGSRILVTEINGKNIVVKHLL